MYDKNNSNPRTNVLGVGVSSVDMDEAVATLLEARQNGETGYVCVTGVHGVIESQRDPELKKIHNRSFLTVPDGMPTVWMGREQGFTKMGRVYGPDLMLEVCRQTSALNQALGSGREALGKGDKALGAGDGALGTGHGALGAGHQALGTDLKPKTEPAEGSLKLNHVKPKTEEAAKPLTHFLYGSTPETLEKLKTNLERKFPGLQIVGTYAPPFRPLNDEEELELQSIVSDCKPDFFWVGLSTPKQEKFMATHCQGNDRPEFQKSEVRSQTSEVVRSQTSEPKRSEDRLEVTTATKWQISAEHPRPPTSDLRSLSPDLRPPTSDLCKFPLEAGIFLGVGAAFPIHAGFQKDAPEWVKNSGLQWLHRLCQEPRRLWRRYLDIVPRFLWLAALQLLGIKKYSID